MKEKNSNAPEPDPPPVAPRARMTFNSTAGDSVLLDAEGNVLAVNGVPVAASRLTPHASPLKE
jgi:hypothetical protein